MATSRRAKKRTWNESLIGYGTKRIQMIVRQALGDKLVTRLSEQANDDELVIR